MNARGDFANDYDEARKLLKENWTGPSGKVKCPQCLQEAIRWEVHEGKANSLSVDCEYCSLGDWIYFQEDPPWSGRD